MSKQDADAVISNIDKEIKSLTKKIDQTKYEKSIYRRKAPTEQVLANARERIEYLTAVKKHAEDSRKALDELEEVTGITCNI